MTTAITFQPLPANSSLPLEVRVQTAMVFLRGLLVRHGFSEEAGLENTAGMGFILLRGHGLALDCAWVDAGRVTGIQGRTVTRLSAATGSRMALRILITVGGLAGTSHIYHVPLDEQQPVERDVVYNVLLTLRDHWKTGAAVLTDSALQLHS